MKRTKLWIAFGFVAAMIGTGCMTGGNERDEASGEVEQAATCQGCNDGSGSGGGSGSVSICDVWTFCYSSCHADGCTSPASCGAQTACYRFCDDQYPGAAGFCPYPDFP